MRGYLKYLGPANHLIRQNDAGAEARWMNLARRTFRDRTVPSLRAVANDAGMELVGMSTEQINAVEELIVALNLLKNDDKIDIVELKRIVNTIESGLVG